MMDFKILAFHFIHGYNYCAAGFSRQQFYSTEQISFQCCLPELALGRPRITQRQCLSVCVQIG